jgi:N-acetylmuramoyl-L-alanine amidase
MREIKRVILHCTATTEGKDYSVETIRKWHLKRGWSDIGYHYLIYLDGSINLGRPVFKQGAHVKSENKDSIGIAYVGGVDKDGEPKDTMTLYQDIAFMRLFEALSVTFGKLDLHGHNEFSNKACPSFDVQEKYKFLIK